MNCPSKLGLIIFTVFTILPRGFISYNVKDLKKYYKTLDLGNSRRLVRNKPHYENSNISSYLYASTQSDVDPQGTKYLYYPYLPESCYAKCKLNEKASAKTQADQQGSNQSDFCLSMASSETRIIVNLNSQRMSRRSDRAKLFESLPYIITHQQQESHQYYSIFKYHGVFDYLKTYLSARSDSVANGFNKHFLKIPDLNIWRLFIVNQLMTGLKALYRLNLLHINTSVSSVVLRSRTEAGWIDTENIELMDYERKYVHISAIEKVYNKKKQASLKPAPSDMERYVDLELYYKRSVYYSPYALYDYYFTNASSVIAFAYLIIEMFDQSLVLRSHDRKPSVIKQQFEDYCDLRRTRQNILCTFLRDIVVDMLNTDVRSKEGIDGYQKRLVSAIADILNADMASPQGKQGPLGNLNDHNVVYAETTLDSFQKHYKDMLEMRINDKYSTCNMPSQKTFRYHVLTFLRDYRKIKPRLLECDKNYDQVLEMGIKALTVGNGPSKTIHRDSVTWDYNRAPCFRKVAQAYSSQICMKGFFEDEAGIFLQYASDEGELRAIIKQALKDASLIEDDILDIWVAAIKAGLSGYPSDII